MDFTEVRIIWTVLSFAVFVAILVWAYSPRARSGFDEASRLLFEDDADQANRRRRDEGGAP